MSGRRIALVESVVARSMRFASSSQFFYAGWRYVDFPRSSWHFRPMMLAGIRDRFTTTTDYAFSGCFRTDWIQFAPHDQCQ